MSLTCVDGLISPGHILNCELELLDGDAVDEAPPPEIQAVFDQLANWGTSR